MVAKINWLKTKIIFCYMLISFSITSPVFADDLALISDAQTQNYLADIIRPLFKAANLAFNTNKIFIINDNALNAFVSDGNYVFVNTGTILEAENTNELAGILAHETGHIMGGHIVRQKLKLEKMQYAMIGSLLAAGATAISTGRGDAAMAVILGAQSSALNSMLHYQTQEERSADESAVKLLSQTEQSTDGLKKFMLKIRKRNSLSGIEENPYFRTHPLTSERISHFEQASKNNHYGAVSSLDDTLKFIKAKLAGFLLDKNRILRIYPPADSSMASRYAHSILYFRGGQITKALEEIDVLINWQPRNPYFHELKGQFLFESGQVAQSIPAYEKALNLLPNNYLLQISLAHAILENNPSENDRQKAINLLQKSIITQSNAFSWQLLARAYDMNNDKASSYYAAAEYSYAIGNLEATKRQLDEAKNASSNQSLKLKIADLQERIKADMKP